MGLGGSSQIALEAAYRGHSLRHRPSNDNGVYLFSEIFMFENFENHFVGSHEGISLLSARCAGSTRNLGRGALHAPRAPPRIGAVRASSPAHASETSPFRSAFRGAAALPRNPHGSARGANRPAVGCRQRFAAGSRPKGVRRPSKPCGIIFCRWIRSRLRRSLCCILSSDGPAGRPAWHSHLAGDRASALPDRYPRSGIPNLVVAHRRRPANPAAARPRRRQFLLGPARGPPPLKLRHCRLDHVDEPAFRRRRVDIERDDLELHPARQQLVGFSDRVHHGSIGAVQIPNDQHVTGRKLGQNSFIDGPLGGAGRERLDVQLVAQLAQAEDLTVVALFGSGHTGVTDLFHVLHQYVAGFWEGAEPSPFARWPPTR